MNIKMLFTALIAVFAIASVAPATYAKTSRSSSEVQESSKVWHSTEETWGAVDEDSFMAFLNAVNNNDTQAGRQLLDKKLVVVFPIGTTFTLTHFMRLGDNGRVFASAVTIRNNAHYWMLFDPNALSDK